MLRWERENKGGTNIAESFLPKKIGDIGRFGDICTFCDMETEKKICSKNENRVGVRNDVICQTFF